MCSLNSALLKIHSAIMPQLIRTLKIARYVAKSCLPLRNQSLEVTMPQYKVIVKGNIYACGQCGTVFDGPGSRHLASQCYKSHATEPEHTNSLPYTTRNGGSKHRTPEQKRLDFLRKELKKVERAARRMSPDYFFNNVYEKDGFYPRNNKKKRRPSPLQSLAYAFHLRDWEQVKHTAYMLAYDKAVRDRLNDFQDYIKGLESKFQGILDAEAMLNENPIGHELFEQKADLADFNFN